MNNVQLSYAFEEEPFGIHTTEVFEVSWFVFVFVNDELVIVPDVAFSPKMYNNIATINVIKINGIKTIIHEITPKPSSHKAFNKNVINIATIVFINAVL